MPLFEYKGYTADGKATRGVRDADTARTLRGAMRREGVLLTEVNEAAMGRKKKGEGRAARSGKVNVHLLAVVTRQFAVLIRSGVALLPALTALAEQVEDPTFARVLGDVRGRINEGASLADALAAHPKIFSAIYINMVSAGESSGALDVVLERLAEFTEGQAALKSKIIGALIYPIVMVAAGGLVMFGMFVFVVPRITKIFDNAEAQLPLLTRALIGVSELLRSPLFLVLLIGLVVAAVISFRAFIRTEHGRVKWDTVLLRLPIFGKINKMVIIARFSRTLATLLEAGVPLLSSCKIVRNVMNNEVLAAVVDDAADAVREGQSFAAPLKRSGEFPPLVHHMVSIGEQSGQLEEMLSNVARSYEQQVDVTVSGITSLIEPILILFMGGGVAIVVFAILMPILQMNQFIH
jgi:general secretion pathway protein F